MSIFFSTLVKGAQGRSLRSVISLDLFSLAVHVGACAISLIAIIT